MIQYFVTDIPNSNPPGHYEYSNYLPSKIGSGYPPMNTSKWPPINFFHLNSCETGNYIQGSPFPDWNYLFYSERSYYVNYTENQAGIAYKVFTYTDNIDEQVDAIYGKLKLGYTVQNAIDTMLTSYNVLISTTESSERRYIQPFDIKFYGDPDMRLTGVFTDDQSLPTTPLTRIRWISD